MSIATSKRIRLEESNYMMFKLTIKLQDSKQYGIAEEVDQ